MTPYFSKEDRLTRVVKSIDSQTLKRAGTVLCRNSIWGGTNYSSSTNFSSFKPSGTRGRRSGFHWCGSAPPLTRLASPPLHFLPPASMPAPSFHGTGQHRPPELLPISSAQIVGRNPSMLLQQRCTALERAGKLKWYLQHPVKPPDILNNNFLPFTFAQHNLLIMSPAPCYSLLWFPFLNFIVFSPSWLTSFSIAPISRSIYFSTPLYSILP